jgi:hypothetical protein
MSLRNADRTANVLVAAADEEMLKTWVSGAPIGTGYHGLIGYYVGRLREQVLQSTDVKGEGPLLDQSGSLRVTAADAKRYDSVRGALASLIDQSTDSSVGMDEAEGVAEQIMLMFNIELP